MFGLLIRVLVGTMLVIAVLAAQNADAATIAPSVSVPRMNEAAAIVAGRSVDAQCVLDSEAWATELRSLNAPPNVLAYVSSNNLNVIRLGPSVCRAWQEGPTGRGFGAALNIVAHEAAHTRGVFSEPEAACWGLLWAADLARRMYGIEFFTPQSEAIIASSRRAHDGLVPQYREVCR